MEKGINKHWTPEQESRSQWLIANSPNFATRDLLLSIRDLLKYDQRTKQGKRAVAKARLRLATATDQDLQEMARLRVFLFGEKALGTVEEALKVLKERRARLRERGIKRSELAGAIYES